MNRRQEIEALQSRVKLLKIRRVAARLKTIPQKRQQDLPALIKNTLDARLEELLSVIRRTRYDNRQQLEALAASLRGEIAAIKPGSDHTEAIAGIHSRLDEHAAQTQEVITAYDDLAVVITDNLDETKKIGGQVASTIGVLTNRVNSLSQQGGGQANRNIVLGGASVLTKYTDIDFVAGTGQSIVATVDNTNKRTKLTFNASAGGFTVLTPTSGLVNSSNTVFNFASAPSLIIADGVLLTAIGNNGDVFWTITGTQVTMTNPPTFSLLGVA